jgi:sucrose-6F-phosphate phosphohydrolase
MLRHLLLCTDLDRTLIPNGPQPESPDARRLFSSLVSHSEVTLVYVSGRDRSRIEQAIEEYGLPVPQRVIADVGTTVYDVRDTGKWIRNASWEEEIGRDWAGVGHNSLSDRLMDFPELRIQEASRQNRFKLSYYVPRDIDENALTDRIRSRLDSIGIRYSLIYSVDEPRNVGLLDILPAGATKLHAIQFVMDEGGFTKSNTVFCGDSGNDLNVLASEIPGVLVGNASPSVRQQAIDLANRQGNGEALYIACGSFLEFNGNYAGGILEGIAHFYPAAVNWMSGSTAETAEH